jgi:hypothetical protein
MTYHSEAQISEPVVEDTTQATLVRYGQELELIKRLKLSGYIQVQYQIADSAGQQSYNGGNFPSGTDKRFAIRRGRIKFQYDSQPCEKGWSTSQYVLQFDVTEKGLAIKDAYLKLTDPYIGWLSLTAGMQNRPFGYEIGLSSSMRETPERGRMSQILFPGERDLGFMLTIQGPKISRWNWLKLEAGVFNGTGARGPGLDASDFDKFKDYMGRIGFSKSTIDERIKYGAGFSAYYGGFRIDSVNVWQNGADSNGVASFTKLSKAIDNYNGGRIGSRNMAKRNYLGVDAQFSIDWMPGITTLRGEYIWGEQPGFSSTTASPANTNSSDIYIRKFNGAYFYFLQNILQSPFQVIVKYDWYDPNTDVKGDDIGKKVTSESKALNSTDIRYDTWGFGLAYRWDANVKITAYYDVVKNETTKNISAYQSDLKDNLFTLRLQVKF